MIPYRELRARIERDQARKRRRREKRRERYDNMDRAATERHYIREIRKCRRGVRFKLSVQKYCARPFAEMEADLQCMLRGTAPPVPSSRKVIIRERGKERIITPIKMRDRVNQRVLCDYALNPMIRPRLIYDNGASMTGKGVGFARKRMNAMLEKAKAKWGPNFWVLTFDFRKFFDSIPHRLCLEEMQKTFRDERIIQATMGFIENYQLLDARRACDGQRIRTLRWHEGTGVCLGSHVSQIMALCVPNFLDHFLKDEKRVKFYIRYMDDGVILYPEKEFLQQLLGEMEKTCLEHGLALNITKTHIIPARKGFTFLKTRYRLDGMRTVKRLNRKSVIRMRRKLRKFKGLTDSGKMTREMVDASVQSWEGHARSIMAFRQRKQIRGIYRDLFGGVRE